jgi:hypothetical protein
MNSDCKTILAVADFKADQRIQLETAAQESGDHASAA